MTPVDATYEGYEFLHLERRGPVGWLLNDRPEQLNAMNSGMRDEFGRAWLELDADPEVRVIVHSGNGRAFQTGVDVAEIASDGVGMQRYRDSMEQFDVHFTAWHQGVRKPVITAINGICCGGGPPGPPALPTPLPQPWRRPCAGATGRRAWRRSPCAPRRPPQGRARRRCARCRRRAR